MMKTLFLSIFLFCCQNQLFCGNDDILTKLKLPQIILFHLAQKTNLTDIKNDPIEKSKLNDQLKRITAFDTFDKPLKEQILNYRINGLDQDHCKQFYNYLRIATIASDCKSKYTASDMSYFASKINTIPDHFIIKGSKRPEEWIAQTGALIYIKDILLEPETTYKNRAQSKNTKSPIPFTLESLRPMYKEVSQRSSTNKESLTKTLEAIRDQTILKASQLLDNIDVKGAEFADVHLSKEDSLDNSYEANKQSSENKRSAYCSKFFYRTFCCCVRPESGYEPIL